MINPIVFSQRWTSKTERIRCVCYRSHMYIYTREPCPALSLTRFFVLPSGSRYGTNSDAHQKASDVFSFLDVDRASNSINCLSSRQRCNANTTPCTHTPCPYQFPSATSCISGKIDVFCVSQFVCMMLPCRLSAFFLRRRTSALFCFSARVSHPFRV